MNLVQYAQPDAVQKLHFNALSADMVQLRCEALLQQNFWFQQQQQLEQENQLLLLNLLKMAVQYANTKTELAQLKFDSQCDPLTNTLNRNIILDRIHQAISIAKRQGSQFALLFIDLDKFKPINDRYGHATGDAILQLVSARLTAAIRDSDAISRHGGDEFLLLLNDTKHIKDTLNFANKLVLSLAKPYQVNSYHIELSASIGIATFPEHGVSACTLIGYADAAMYQAKQQGGCKAC